MLIGVGKSSGSWQVECRSHSSGPDDQRFKVLILLESHSGRMCSDAVFLDALRYRSSESSLLILCSRQLGLLPLELCLSFECVNFIRGKVDKDVLNLI